MESSDFQRDLEAEVSASLPSIRLPGWLKQGAENISKTTVRALDAFEMAVLFVVRPGGFVRKRAPGIRPEQAHEFLSPARRGGPWGGGLV